MSPGAGLPWYAVQVRAHNEQKTAKALVSKGYECLVPVYRQRRKWSDRTKIVELALFPGYLFSRFDVQKRLPVLTTDGVISVVGIGKTPHPLDPHEMEQIRMVVDLNHPALPCPFLKVGQRVRITAGPLTGVQGLLAQRRGETRVVLTVSVLEKAISVQVESDAIQQL